MEKIEMIKTWLQDNNNIKWIYKEVDLYLENNYSPAVQYLYNLVEDTKEELEEHYKKIDRKQALKLKWYIIKAFEDALILGINYDLEKISLSTIKRACKELNFYSTITTDFINSLNGESENIEELKKVFKKYYLD